MAIGAGASTDSFATCGAGDLVIHLGEFEGRSTLGPFCRVIWTMPVGAACLVLQDLAQNKGQKADGYPNPERDGPVD